MLNKYAKGLPRYSMDCGWWRHPKFAGLDTDALFLVQAAVGYANEHGTDGWLPADLEDLAIAIGIRQRVIKPGAAALIKRGILEQHGERLMIVGFSDHNPTSEEAAAYSDERRAKALLGNHRRWHHNVKNPTCPHCVGEIGEGSPPTSSEESPDDSSDDPGSDPPANPQAVVRGSQGNGREGTSPPTPPLSDPTGTPSDGNGHTNGKAPPAHPDQAVLDHIGRTIGWTTPRRRAELVTVWDHGITVLDRRVLEETLLACTDARHPNYLRQAITARATTPGGTIR